MLYISIFCIFCRFFCLLTIKIFFPKKNNDNDNDNELFIQTKSNEKHHKCNIINTYKNTNITTGRAKEIVLKTSWPLAYNHLYLLQDKKWW